MQKGGSKPSAASTIACAGVAGGLAGMIGNPTEVVLVRMCADGAKPQAEQFGYPNPIVALYRIGRDEGLKVFGRGMSANIVRSVLMSKPLCHCALRQRRGLSVDQLQMSGRLPPTPQRSGLSFRTPHWRTISERTPWRPWSQERSRQQFAHQPMS